MNSKTAQVRRRLFALPVLLALFAAPAFAGENVLGFGIHYWRTVDDIKDDGFGDIDSKGTSGVVSYQYFPGGPIGIELDLEYFDKGFSGSTEAAYAPQFYLVFGHRFYLATGIGMTYSDGLEDSPSDPFYAGRLGVNVLLLPGVGLDLNANYRSNTYKGLRDAETDTVTLGAILRITL
jgi:hypothetical protein